MALTKFLVAALLASELAIVDADVLDYLDQKTWEFFDDVVPGWNQDGQGYFTHQYRRFAAGKYKYEIKSLVSAHMFWPNEYSYKYYAVTLKFYTKLPGGGSITCEKEDVDLHPYSTSHQQVVLYFLAACVGKSDVVHTDWILDYSWTETCKDCEDEDTDAFKQDLILDYSETENCKDCRYFIAKMGVMDSFWNWKNAKEADKQFDVSNWRNEKIKANINAKANIAADYQKAVDSYTKSVEKFMELTNAMTEESSTYRPTEWQEHWRYYMATYYWSWVKYYMGRRCICDNGEAAYDCDAGAVEKRHSCVACNDGYTKQNDATCLSDEQVRATNLLKHWKNMTQFQVRVVDVAKIYHLDKPDSYAAYTPGEFSKYTEVFLVLHWYYKYGKFAWSEWLWNINAQNIGVDGWAEVKGWAADHYDAARTWAADSNYDTRARDYPDADSGYNSLVNGDN